MAYYTVYSFAGTTLISANRKQVRMMETLGSVSRIWILENGAKLDADGTSDADEQLGQVTVRYQIIPEANGMIYLDSHVAVFQGIHRRLGTLLGNLYGATTTTRSCTARCLDVIPEAYDAVDPPMIASARQRAFITVVWEKETDWV